MASRYPDFLPFTETAKLQLSFFAKGLFHASRWDLVFSAISRDAELRGNISKACMLNALTLIFIYCFDFFLQPLLQNQEKWLHRQLGLIYRVGWLLPVIGASFYLNSSWTSIIANRAYIISHGGNRGTHVQQPSAPLTYNGVLNTIATSAYRGVMLSTSVVLSFLLGSLPIPYIGKSVAFMFVCWVDAYYCFEPVWVARGMSLTRRVQHLEERWAYYLAFGLPCTLLCMWGNTLFNTALFALLFPGYIIMAMHSKPVPNDPYNPAQDHATTLPSPYVPVRVPVFAIVMWINDRLLRVLNLGTGGRGVKKGDDWKRASIDAVEDGVPSISLKRVAPRARRKHD